MTSRRLWVAAAAVVLVAAIVGVARWAPWSTAPGLPAGLDADEVALGLSVYEAHCRACHGPDGAGTPDWRTRREDGTLPPPPHDGSGHTWHHADGLLYRIVRDGGADYAGPAFPTGMPGFGGVLEPRGIRAVITYLKTLWDDEQRAYQARLSEADPFPPEADGGPPAPR